MRRQQYPKLDGRMPKIPKPMLTTLTSTLTSMSMRTLMISIFAVHSMTHCLAFQIQSFPTLRPSSSSSSSQELSSSSSLSELSMSVDKRQTAIFDGAEFMSIASVLRLELEHREEQMMRMILVEKELEKEMEMKEKKMKQEKEKEKEKEKALHGHAESELQSDEGEDNMKSSNNGSDSVSGNDIVNVSGSVSGTTVKEEANEVVSGMMNAVETAFLDMQELPSERAGYMTFITGTYSYTDDHGNERNKRVLGIQECNGKDNDNDNDNNNDNNNGEVRDSGNNDQNPHEEAFPVPHSYIKMEENIYIRKDSMVTIPENISNEDAISTAVAALSGVRCSMPMSMASMSMSMESSSSLKAVVLGGGDYACYLAKALDVLGADVTLVTTRPMSLKDTPLNPLRDANGKYDVN